MAHTQGHERQGRDSGTGTNGGKSFWNMHNSYPWNLGQWCPLWGCGHCVKTISYDALWWNPEPLFAERFDQGCFQLLTSSWEKKDFRNQGSIGMFLTSGSFEVQETKVYGEQHLYHGLRLGLSTSSDLYPVLIVAFSKPQLYIDSRKSASNRDNYSKVHPVPALPKAFLHQG